MGSWFSLGVKWIAWQRGLPRRTGGRRKQCMVPYRSSHIFGTWRSLQRGVDLKLSYRRVGAIHKWVGQFFYWGGGGSWPFKTACKDFQLAIGQRLDWAKWIKNRVEKGFVFHAIIPALYNYILLVKLKNLYTQHAWILIMEKQNSNQKCEGWKDGVVCRTFWPLPWQV